MASPFASFKGDINLGGPNLNIDTTTARGLERAIGYVGAFFINAQIGLYITLYGIKSQQETKKGTKFRNLINEVGIIPILDELTKVDFCNLLGYATANVNLGLSDVFTKTKFNPAGPRDDAGKFEKAVWRTQKIAFDAQVIIDRYYARYGTLAGSDARIGLLELVGQLNRTLDNLISTSELFNDPELRRSFPEIDLIRGYFKEQGQKFTNIVNSTRIDSGQIETIIKEIDKIRRFFVLIQSLTIPSNLLQVGALFSPKLEKRIANLFSDSQIDTERLVSSLSDILVVARKLNTFGVKTLNYISRIRFYTRIIINTFRLIERAKLYFDRNPLPNLYTTLGITTLVNKIYKNVLEKEGTEKLLSRIEQIDGVLNIAYNFSLALIAASNDIKDKLNIIKLNLEQCNRDLYEQVNNEISSLQETLNELQSFVDQYNNNVKTIDNTFGGYTIEIVTEELTDENIDLKRRYGIARGRNGIIAAESTPTFASLDLIIINEVKSLLVAKGLVKQEINRTSLEETSKLLEALKFLGEDQVNIDSIINSNVLETNDRTGQRSFVDKLPGGRALRKRVKDAMAKSSIELKTNLSNIEGKTS